MNSESASPDVAPQTAPPMADMNDPASEQASESNPPASNPQPAQGDTSPSGNESASEQFVASGIGRPRIGHTSQNIQDGHIEVIMDVPITLSLEIGRTRITIGELLQLNPGSVVKLDRMAGEPMDVMVNGCLIAKGEVVTVGEKFGVRIAEVVSAEERIKSLR